MELHAGLLRGSPVTGSDLQDFPDSLPEPSGGPGKIVSLGMEGGRETGDLEVRLHWPGHADEDASAGEPPSRPESDPTTEEHEDDPGPTLVSSPAAPDRHIPEIAGADRGALKLAISELREELLEELADLRSEFAGDVSGPVRDLAIKVAANAAEVQRLVESLLDLQQTEVDRLRREIDSLRREVRQSQKAPPPWFAEAVSASLREELEGLAGQVQMLRRRVALKGREESRIDSVTAEKIAEAVTARLEGEGRPQDRTTAARRSRRT